MVTRIPRGWFRTLAGASTGTAWGVFLAWTAAYAVAATALARPLGPSALALVSLPVAVGAWYFGARGGIALALALTLATGALERILGRDAALLAHPGEALLAGVLAILTGAAVGAFRERELALRAAKRTLEQQLAERDALAAASHLQTMALSAAPVGLVITDKLGYIEWVNPHFCAMTGYAADEVVGRHTRMLNAGRQPRAFYAELWDTVLAGEVWRGELINRRKDGTEYVEAMAITPVRDGSGKLSHFVAAKRDVTGQRAATRHIEELNATLAQQVRRLETLHTIDTIITAGMTPDRAVDAFLQALAISRGLDTAALFLLRQGHLVLYAASGSATLSPAGLTLALGEGVAGRAGQERATVVIQGREQILELVAAAKIRAVETEGLELFAAVPMIVRGELRGVLEVGARAAPRVDAAWRRALEEIATQGAILLDNVALLNDLRASNEQLRATYDATIEGWSRALDLRDKETEGHSRRVTELTLALARAVGLEGDDLVQIRRGALLHDIGKMGVPDAILQKPGPLTDEEWAIMKRHPGFAYALLQDVAFLRPALEIPHAHHERWDGGGYPRGLRGDAIPLSARLFAVVDVYDALTSERPYRPAWTREAALRHVREGAGTHFDPAVVDAFLALMRDGPPASRAGAPEAARRAERSR